MSDSVREMMRAKQREKERKAAELAAALKSSKNKEQVGGCIRKEGRDGVGMGSWLWGLESSEGKGQVCGWVDVMGRGMDLERVIMW